MFTIELGKKVIDRITEFSGIVLGRVEYLTGCRQYLVAGKSDGTRPSESAWFDEDRLGVAENLSKNAGGPQAHEAPRK